MFIYSHRSSIESSFPTLNPRFIELSVLFQAGARSRKISYYNYIIRRNSCINYLISNFRWNSRETVWLRKIIFLIQSRRFRRWNDKLHLFLSTTTLDYNAKYEAWQIFFLIWNENKLLFLYHRHIFNSSKRTY